MTDAVFILQMQMDLNETSFEMPCKDSTIVGTSEDLVGFPVVDSTHDVVAVGIWLLKVFVG